MYIISEYTIRLFELHCRINKHSKDPTKSVSLRTFTVQISHDEGDGYNSLTRHICIYNLSFSISTFQFKGWHLLQNKNIMSLLWNYICSRQAFHRIFYPSFILGSNVRFTCKHKKELLCGKSCLWSPYIVQKYLKIQECSIFLDYWLKKIVL